MHLRADVGGSQDLRRKRPFDTEVTTQRPSAWLCVVRFNLRIVEVTEEC
jgi:hypothetical protein